ncbi:MAG: hypothetical protein KatS3mg103_0404 [Phycisphaerales bacterium]|nr:MAG: hypothetical protein KatS3mg103_0404 [Phycisphaerales bacterium]
MDAFADRLAIVTGASDGIGLACARKLAEQGARVVVNARRAGRLDELVEIDPARVVPVAGDASRPDTIEAMLDAAARLGGRQADLVIANAGRGLAGSPLGSDPTQWPAVVEVNLLGAAMLIRRAAERMLAEIDQQPPTQAAAHAAGPGQPVGRRRGPGPSAGRGGARLDGGAATSARSAASTGRPRRPSTWSPRRSAGRSARAGCG